MFMFMLFSTPVKPILLLEHVLLIENMLVILISLGQPYKQAELFLLTYISKTIQAIRKADLPKS